MRRPLQGRALLGTSSVNAVDRVGTGPLCDRLGRTLSDNTAQLLDDRPIEADPARIDEFPNQYAAASQNDDGTGRI